MLLRTFAAIVAVVAVPIAVNGAERPAPRVNEDLTKRVCEASVPTGSRLGGVRRCHTKVEADEIRREQRQVIDRVQAMKPTICGPGGTRAC